MTVIQFPSRRRQSGVVYQPAARGEILRVVFRGLVKTGGLAIKAGIALMVAIAFTLSIILGLFK